MASARFPSTTRTTRSRFDVDGYTAQVGYEPGESLSGLFGGNSNWRGPVWFPLNYILIESLEAFHSYLGDDFTVEYPTGSGNEVSLHDVASRAAETLGGLVPSRRARAAPLRRRERAGGEAGLGLLP